MTVQFATMEHHLQSLLKTLVGQDNGLIGPLFIHELNLFVLLRKVGHVAQYRLRENIRLLEDLKLTLKHIDATRELRNLLVHGEWHIDQDCKTCPVRVRDFRMKYGNGQWQELTETTFNEKKLTQLNRRLTNTNHELKYLIDRIQDNSICCLKKDSHEGRLVERLS